MGESLEAGATPPIHGDVVKPSSWDKMSKEAKADYRKWGSDINAAINMGDASTRKGEGSVGKTVPTPANISSTSPANHFVEVNKLVATSEISVVKEGDYVLATKYEDGDPADAWGIGYYAGFHNDRHYVIDAQGKQIRMNGFRRVAAISQDYGTWLWHNRKELEASPAGMINLWGMLSMQSPIKPVVVSLEKCFQAINHFHRNAHPMNEDKFIRCIAKAVLDSLKEQGVEVTYAD